MIEIGLINIFEKWHQINLNSFLQRNFIFSPFAPFFICESSFQPTPTQWTSSSRPSSRSLPFPEVDLQLRHLVTWARSTLPSALPISWIKKVWTESSNNMQPFSPSSHICDWKWVLALISIHVITNRGILLYANLFYSSQFSCDVSITYSTRHLNKKIFELKFHVSEGWNVFMERHDLKRALNFKKAITLHW